jgi:hypothetical protein
MTMPFARLVVESRDETSQRMSHASRSDARVERREAPIVFSRQKSSQVLRRSGERRYQHHAPLVTAVLIHK